MKIGDEVTLELSQIGKVCHKKCAIYYLAGDCIFPREGIFFEVVTGGTVSVGDSIIVTKMGDGHCQYTPQEALDEIARHCKIAVVKVGKDGSMLKSGDEYHYIEPWPADTLDATGAGDTYAAGFLYAHSRGMPLKVCGEIGSIIAAKVVEIIGTKIDIPRWKAAKAEIRELIAANGGIAAEENED